ncbi:ADAM metallopeptidase with thrombospondin type 1 motif [Chamberlinius hualienensis]
MRALTATRPRQALAVWPLLLILASASKVDDTSGRYTFLNQRQENFVRELQSYDVIAPIKLTPEGNFASHELNHRVRRHVNDDQLNSVHYRLRLDNRDVFVRLHSNHRWLAPSMVIERWNVSQDKTSYGKLTPRTIKKIDDEHCFFKGYIINQTNAQVALSACDGLLGYLNVNDERYIIEPLRKPPKGEVEGGSGSSPHPHIIYKRSAIPKKMVETEENHLDDQTCGMTDGDNYQNAIREREVWERSVKRKSRKKFKRKKRSVSSERFVETLVVADKMMVDYYTNDDIETYILTIFNMISELYHDATIGNAVNIALVRLILLEDEDQENELTVNHHADHSLKSFCKWQKQINPKEDSHPNHHDVAILITRYNICTRMNEPCSTLGLAEVAGMCQPGRSCNINEDSGLALAYTISHEIGHNFGMNHDGPHNGCEPPFGERQHVMSPHLSSDTSPFAWSNCSRTDITKFFDHDWGSCLDDEPSPHNFVFPEVPPGVMYDVNHQCWLQYGPNSSYCEEIEQDVCTTLWCRQENKCVTRLEPAAPGTHCSPNKWCFNGNCIEMGERPESINGGWGGWSEWTPCSRTCGAGVTQSSRNCDTPAPRNGGLYCIGERRRYKICNIMPCPEDAPSFRAVQCSKYNQTPYKDKYRTWDSVLIKVTPCQLHCKPDDDYYSVMLAEMVENGTPCNPGTRDMCISGKCRKVACDWIIDSDAQEDRCGLCHGDGTQCQTIRGEFNQKSGSGYVKVATIPAGARSIRIEELEESPNYISIMDGNETHRLNGNWLIQWSGDYDFPGTIMYYRREGEYETLHAPGKIRQDMHIYMLFQGQNKGVKYEYTVANRTTRTPEFFWEYSEWSLCTVTCGVGVQTAVAKCMEKEAGLVEDKYCNETIKPANMTRTCNLQTCPSAWWNGPWQHCSVTCGDNGVRRRTVICTRPKGEDEQIALPDSDCSIHDKPTEHEPCHNKRPCLQDVYWKVGIWSDTCDGDPCSFQTRSVVCSDNDLCQGISKPLDKRQCGQIQCGTWMVGNWSECSKPCGEGAQFRRVYCEGGLKCRDSVEPLSVRICYRNCSTVNDGNLSLKSEVESSGNKSNVNLTAGETFNDNFFDIDEKSNTIDTADNKEKSDQHSTEIISEDGNLTNDLLNHDNSSDWHLGKRDKKHKHLKDGRKIPKRGRKIVVDKVNPDIFKGVEIRILNHKDINNHLSKENNDFNGDVYAKLANVSKSKSLDTEMQPEFEWVIKPWSTCSMPCSGGSRYRDVLCYELTTETLVDSGLCNLRQKPNETENCNEEPCSEWQLTEWSECTKTCGEGVKMRDVWCPEGDSCNPQTQPKAVMQCRNQPCVEWVTGQWSQCSVTCGSGIQTRYVTCIQTDSQQPADGCEFIRKPQTRQSCNSVECIEKSLAKFSSCIDKLESKLCFSLRHMCSQWYFKVKCCHTCHKQTSLSSKNKLHNLQ